MICASGLTLLFLTALAWGDDATFRDLPLQSTPTPERLTELISNPALRRLVDQAQGRLREGPGREAAEWSEEEDHDSSPENSPLNEDLLKEMEEVFRSGRNRNAAESLPQPHQADDPLKRPAESRNASPQTPRTKSQPGAERSPNPPSSEDIPTPSPSSRPEASRPAERVRRSDDDARKSGPRPGSGDPVRPQPSSHDEARSRSQPLENFRPPQNSARTESATRTPPEPQKPLSKRQIDDSINRIVMDAARRVAEQDAETGRMESALSRESFLTPLVKEARQSLARRNGWDDRSESWLRNQSRRMRRSELADRLNWKPSIAGPASLEAPGWSSELRLLAAPVVFGAVVLVLLPAWLRLRPKLVAYLRATATLASLRTVMIKSPRDLVGAVDQFLLAQFGLSAAWWHCRTVERELRKFRPDLSQAISELASVYELSRFGPDTAAIDPARLAQSAETLRRLAAPPQEQSAVSPSGAA